MNKVIRALAAAGAVAVVPLGLASPAHASTQNNNNSNGYGWVKVCQKVYDYDYNYDYWGDYSIDDLYHHSWDVSLGGRSYDCFQTKVKHRLGQRLRQPVRRERELRQPPARLVPVQGQEGLRLHGHVQVPRLRLRPGARRGGVLKDGSVRTDGPAPFAGRGRPASLADVPAVRAPDRPPADAPAAGGAVPDRPAPTSAAQAWVRTRAGAWALSQSASRVALTAGTRCRSAVVTTWIGRREAGSTGRVTTSGWLRAAQDEVGDERHAEALGDQPEHGDVVLGLERDVGGEAGLGAQLQQVAATAGAAGDPRLAARVGQVADRGPAMGWLRGRARRTSSSISCA